jgi:hypothetical protein
MPYTQIATLNRVAAIAAGTAGIGAERVKKGYTNYADNYDWEAAVRSLAPQVQGFFSCWLQSCDNLSQNEAGKFRIAAELAVYVPKDLSSDMSDAWNFVLDFAARLLDQANYQEGELRPSAISIHLQKVLGGTPGVCIFDFGARRQGKMEFVAP